MDKRLKVAEYEALRMLLSGDKDNTNGIIDVELEHLAWLGAQVREGGDVVEIGSHRGKSICAMGCGVRAAGNEGKVRLFAVDLWTKGTNTFAHYRSEETWEIFQRQVAAMGLSEAVRPVIGRSTEMAKKRRKPIALLFIDAAHDYKNVLGDFRAWSPFVEVGGRIAFHDYGTRFKGVDRVVHEEVMASGEWEDATVIGRIWSAVRVRR